MTNFLFSATLLKEVLDSTILSSNDTTVVNEIFCLLPHSELAATADAYNRKYSVNIRDRLQAKLSRNHLYLMTKLLQSGRSEDQNIDETLAIEQATQLHATLNKSNVLGGLSDETTSELIDLIVRLSHSQAEVVKKQFEIQFPSEPSVDALIDQRIGGALKQALHLLLSVPTSVYARKIRDACDGGADDSIWRIIGGLFEWNYTQ